MNPNRIYRKLLIVLLLFSVSGATLQAQIRLALLGGVHSSDFIQKNSIPGYDSAQGKYFSSGTGIQIGVLAEIPFGKYNLYFQPGLIYSSKGNQYERFYDSTVFKTDTLYNQHTLNLSYVEIPLYLTWKVSLSKNQQNHFYISAGPYFSFIYSASQSYQNRVKDFASSKFIYNSGTNDLSVGNGPDKYKTYDIGIDAKAGFELGSVFIGAYFSQGLTNAYTATYPATFHNKVFGGSFGVWLNKPKPVSQPVKDTDQDGTPDKDDSCKTIAGPPKYHGCPIPDSDHDGINDEQDSCKLIPGVAKYHGCPVPDSDNDGINDEEDSCKTIPGVKKYHGCPIPDSDQDGVNDELDKCPNQPGPPENQGCPVVKDAIKARAQLLSSSVMFNTNSIKLTKGSYPGIKELADSLKANPDLDLRIDGHTDNSGNHAYNLKLSLERAAVVKNALLNLGIADNRIQVRGFGDSQPVAGNESAEGRAKNRRVVCVFQLKNR